MEAIATLIQDDPYLKLSAAARLTAHKARRARFEASAFKQNAVANVDEAQVEILEDRWAALARKPGWFSIVSEDSPPGSAMKIDDVIRVCCKYFDMTRSEITSARRTAPVVYVRQIAMYLCKYHTTKSYPEIGRRLGGRDHTTVIHGHRRVESQLLKNAGLAYDVAQVEAML